MGQTLPIRIEWDSEAGCFVAYDDTFGWYGCGDTKQEAMEHVAEVILEDFLDLQAEEGNLLPDLEEKLQRMRHTIDRKPGE